MRNKLTIFGENIKGEVNLNVAASQAISIMDNLDDINLKEATFKDGTQFKSNDECRSLINKGVMFIETPNEYQIRIAKNGSSADELVNSNAPIITQKMEGAFIGESQSNVSKRRSRNKSF